MAKRDGGLPFLLLALLVAGLGVAGYVGYELYPRFDLPAADGAALLLLAVAAGVASFFSPCAFGLLVTLVARETGGDEGSPGAATRLRRPWTFATGFSAGAALFVLVTGAVIGLGGAGLVAGVTFTSAAGRVLRVAVGAFLVLLGLVQLDLLPNPFRRMEGGVRSLRRAAARERRRRPLWSHGLFGFGYLLAGFG